MAERRFLKYRILVERVDEEDVVKREWKQVADTGGPDGGASYAYATYPDTSYKTSKVLEMEIDSEANFSIKKVVKAMLGLE